MAEQHPDPSAEGGPKSAPLRETSRGGVSLGGRGGASLPGGGPACPYLSSVDRGRPYDTPSRRNSCTAETKTAWQGLRRINAPVGLVTRARQTKLCLAEFTECVHHAKAKKMEEKEASSPRKEKAKAAPRAARKASKKRSQPQSDRFTNSQMDTFRQLGTIGFVTVVIAFIVAFLFSEKASNIYDSIAYSVIRSQAQSLGLDKDALDKAKAAGLLKGGAIKGLKNLTGAQKAKLKARFKARGGK